jgi:hypothetical protein
MKPANDTDEMIDGLRDAQHRESQVTVQARWAALAMGALSGEEAEALRRASPELYEMYRPFDAAEDERLLAAIAARLALKATPTDRPALLPPEPDLARAKCVSIVRWRQAQADLAPPTT